MPVQKKGPKTRERRKRDKRWQCCIRDGNGIVKGGIIYDSSALSLLATTVALALLPII